MKSIICGSAWIKSLVIAAVVLVPMGSAFAHSSLAASSPGHQAVVMSPDELMLRFNEQVRLLRVTLVHQPSHNIDFGFEASTAAQQEFSYELPMLMLGEHTVTWTVIGADGHTVSNSFSFTVSNDGAEAGMQTHQGGHQH
jgi:methionine-rich copper-binding protein CopC